MLEAELLGELVVGGRKLRRGDGLDGRLEDCGFAREGGFAVRLGNEAEMSSLSPALAPFETVFEARDEATATDHDRHIGTFAAGECDAMMRPMKSIVT